MGDDKQIRFMMMRITVVEFAILTESLPKNEHCSFTADMTFMADAVEGIVACDGTFLFKESDTPFMKLVVRCEFKVESNDWRSLKQDSKVAIPRNFLCHIAVHTVGTARGILFSKTESTPFNIFILPPVNVESMIPGDFVIDTNA